MGQDILVPDLAGWKETRFPESEDHNWISAVPDWICEILSPSTAKIDKTDKIPLYAQNRVSHLWLIDPSAKTLDVFRLEAGRWMLLSLFAEADKVRAEPFEEIEIDLNTLWIEGRRK
jgi:Uma2 family endonuclease